jgi:hypothetical protein
MSGDVHRRHPATRSFAAALACALAWLGLALLACVAPAFHPGDAGTVMVVTQPAPSHVAQRAVVRVMHVRAAVVSASQRTLSGPPPLRTVAVALLVLFGLGVAPRRPPRRSAIRMHGVRAPPVVPAGAVPPAAGS